MVKKKNVEEEEIKMLDIGFWDLGSGYWMLGFTRHLVYSFNLTSHIPHPLNT